MRPYPVDPMLRSLLQRPWLRALGVPLFLACSFALSCWSRFMEPGRILARDSLYHLGHAALSASRGLTYSAFPSTAYSVVREYAADIWYGFHVLLVPFTFLRFPPDREIYPLQWAGALMTTALLAAIYVTVRRGRMVLPWLWPFVLVVPSLYRFAQTRPHLLSTALTGLLFGVLVRGGAVEVLLIAAALSWVHLALFWLGLLTAIVVVSVRWCVERVLEWRKLAATVAGLLAGWLLRPNPIGAARILDVQLVQLLLARGREIPVSSFGVELSPIPLVALLDTHAVFVAAWLALGALVPLAVLRPGLRVSAERRTWLWSSLALSVLFFGMTVRLYLRAMDSWALFATLLMAGVATCAWTAEGGLRDALAPRSARVRLAARAAIAVVAASLCAGMAWQQLLGGGGGYIRWMPNQVDPYRFRAASQWLSRNTSAGSIVFHSNWGIFPELFYWNRHNTYIGGMDPIFEYAYDRRLYWEATHLDENPFSGANTWGVGAPDGVGPVSGYRPSTVPGTGIRAFAVSDPAKALQVDTYTALRRDFHASYLFVPKELEAAELSGRPDPDLLRWNEDMLVEQHRFFLPMLYDYAWQDPRLVSRYEDDNAVVFEITGPPPADPQSPIAAPKEEPGDDGDEPEP